jgi:hypothetical protein
VQQQKERACTLGSHVLEIVREADSSAEIVKMIWKNEEEDI